MLISTVNGVEDRYDGNPDMLAALVLRDEAGRTGTKYGCGQAAVRGLRRARQRLRRACLHRADVGGAARQ